MQICLDTYRHLRLVDLNRKQKLAQITEDRIGGLTLDWLWRGDRRWAHVLEHEHHLFEAITYYLVAEGLEEYLLGLMKVEPHPSVRSSSA